MNPIFDLLNRILAPILDRFKVKSPVLFAIVVIFLTSIKSAIDSGLIPVDDSVANWILFIIALFTGYQTKQFIKRDHL